MNSEPDNVLPRMIDGQIIVGMAWSIATCIMAWGILIQEPWPLVFAGGIFYLVGTYAMLRSWMELQDVLRMGYEPLGPVDSFHDDDTSRTMVGN